MDALSRESSAKRLKVDPATSLSIAVNGIRNADQSGRANTNDPKRPTQTSESVYLDKYQIPCSRYPAGSEIVTQLKYLGGSSCAELANPLAKAAKIELPSDTEPTLKGFFTEPDRADSKAQLDGRVKSVCTYDEALAIRYHARELGLEKFFQESVVQHHVPLHALCTAFCVPPPALLLDPPDGALRNRLKKAIAVDMCNRIKLQKYNSVNDAIALVQKAKNIVVITGAGVSTSLGIPDFRSPDGLYSKLADMGFQDPESIFSRDTFEQDPQPFFSVASMILPPTDGRFSPAHAFLRLLQDKGKLLTLYTQNIDGIDLTAGIRRDKLVQLHGSFETATCTICPHRVDGQEIFPQLRKGKIPICAKCATERQIRADQMVSMRAQSTRPLRRKPQRSSVDSITASAGIIRPDIVFMGEPPRPHSKRFKRDCAKVDLMIVMGTSLPVEPVNTMPNRIPPKVPQIYIGKKQMYPASNKRIDFDIQLLGECDVVAKLLAQGCGWDLEHEMLPKDTFIAIKPWFPTRHCHEVRRRTGEAEREVEESDTEE